MTRDEEWMRRALELALRAEKEGEVPVGALVVRDEQLLGEGWNQPVALRDPTAHAEVLAMRAAAQRVAMTAGWHDALVTLEPADGAAAMPMHASNGCVLALGSEPGAAHRLTPVTAPA